METSSYPGLDKVSTCGNLPHIVLKLKSLKVPRSAQISIFGGGGGYSESEKVKVPRYAQISIFGGGGVIPESEKSKCQDMPKFQFSGGVF